MHTQTLLTAALRISVFLTAAVVAFPQEPTSESGSFMLRGGTVHTISGPVIENGSVLVRDGKIVGVGQNLTPPEGTRIVDVAGQQVYPGMIDSASRMKAVRTAGEQMPAARGNGVTTALEIPDGDSIAVSGSTVWLKFPAIETMPIPPHEVEDDDDEPTTALDPQVISYSEAKKTFAAKMRTLNLLFDAARKYRRTKRTGSIRTSTDARFEAMIPVFEGKVPMFVVAVREREIRNAIAFADKQKIKIVLADAYEAYKVIPLIKAHNIAVVLGPTLSLPLNVDDPYDLSYTTPSALQKAGIQFSIGSFSARMTRNLPYQAAAAVPFGLSREDAYKAVSLNAAEIYGLGKRLGSVEEGKSADLIVTDGDPLESMTHVKMVFIDGKPMDLNTRQKQLYETYRGEKDAARH